jgi:FAD:protein FMN transferase
VFPDLAVPDGLRALSFPSMGTHVRVLAPSGSLEPARALTERLFARWEGVLSRFLPESDLSRANAAAGRPVEVDGILLDVTEAALAAARATGGFYDPTLERELVRIGYDRSFELIGTGGPPADRPRRGGAWTQVKLDRERGTITVPAGCGLDLGGIAKGMAADAALDELAARGIRPALVSAGGDLAVRGLPPGGSWDVLVGDGGDAQVVPLLRGALATSGTTNRAWRQGTFRRHHVVDPRSGEPARSGLRQVTVAASTGRAAEAMATAVLVAGAALGVRLVERAGLAALLVTDSGRPVTAGRWPQAARRSAA